VDLRALLRDVEALMRPQASAKALALHLDTDPAVPERVMADPTRLKQVLFNLLSNAIKFSDRGAVVLDLRLRPGIPGEQELEFAVVDTGMGMDEATLGRLFTRFVQGDNSRSRRHPGAGLGLEISRNLARLMRGDITVSSRVGEGSCFTLRLPLTPVPATVEPAPKAAPILAAGARALHVLVAEDHPVNRQYIAALLENLGHQAEFASNGEAAVAAARETRFDLVLMDLHMPVLDGVAATRAIRALPQPARSTVPIVAMTADGFQETRERCLVAGMNDFLSKPVGREKLGSLLRQLFGSGAGVEPSAVRGPLQAGTDLGHPDAVRLLDLAHAERLRQSLGPDMLASLLADYFDQAGPAVSRLRAAVRDGQPLDLRGQAHAARGAALNLGLHGLAATAQTLHDGAAHLPAHEVARLVQRFEDQIAATHGVVRQAGLLRQAAAAMPAVATR
jgi:CheY-like chemotaxis protein